METPPTSPTPVQTDAGLQSVVALFTKDKTRIRFVTDFMIQDQQITPTVRRLSFVYAPENPNEIEGKDLEFLNSIDVFAVNYSDIFRLEKFAQDSEAVTLRLAVLINGLEIGTMNQGSAPGVLAAGQANASVGELFRQIPAAYAKAVAR